MEEVAKHNSAGDVWLVINGGVYSVGNWLGSHPGLGCVVLRRSNFRWVLGGELPLLGVAGKDCTDAFRSAPAFERDSRVLTLPLCTFATVFHSSEVMEKQLARFQIGAPASSDVAAVLASDACLPIVHNQAW